MFYHKPFFFLVLLVAACRSAPIETAPAPISREVIVKAAFPVEWQSHTIASLTLHSKTDTINYALGVAWANGIRRVGLNRIGYSFYLGAFDYFVQNPSFINVVAAGQRLDRELYHLHNDSLPPLDLQTELGNIMVQSPFDTLSYELGYIWCKGAKQYGIDSLRPVLLLGLSRALQGDTSLFTYAQADHYLRAYVRDKKAVQYAMEKKTNEDWLAANALQTGITTLPDGVQYKVIQSGAGPAIGLQDVVDCRYTAKLINRQVFESSGGEPLRLYPFSVVKGWQQALLHMRQGGHWEIYVPAALGYGADGIPNKVPPFSTLIYEVEVLNVEKKS